MGRPRKEDVSQDKINEMDRLIDFEDRMPVGRIAKARDKVVRQRINEKEKSKY